LREIPASINKQIDSLGDSPVHATALGRWTHVEEVDGMHSHDESQRKELVQLLLDHGADPTSCRKMGMTALDIAHEAGARALRRYWSGKARSGGEMQGRG